MNRKMHNTFSALSVAAVLMTAGLIASSPARQSEPEVLAAISIRDAVPAGTPRGTEARFYANLYVGLWYESEGDAAKTLSHLAAAVEQYKIGHYMWDVGDAHLKLLRSKK